MNRQNRQEIPGSSPQAASGLLQAPFDLSDVPVRPDLAVLTIGLAISAAQRVQQWRKANVVPAEGPLISAELLNAKTTSTDLVTSADKQIEEWLVDQIRQHRPHDHILGEEGGAHTAMATATDAPRWVLDPIDGTVNFVLGIPRYAVSVAVELDGRSYAGCVVNAASQTVHWAVRGAGAWLVQLPDDAALSALPEATVLAASYLAHPAEAGYRLQGPRPVTLPSAVIGTGFGYDRARRGRQAAVAGQLLPRVADIRRLGAASLDLCSVAVGNLDGYYEAGLSPWDFAAGLLIAREAGCVSSGLRGEEPSSAFVAVCAEAMAQDFFDLLEELDADLR